MIRSIEIKNFRCFQHLEISDCSRINVIVGDNGSGKTALLEGIFLALGSSPELGLRFRKSRGLDGSFSGTPRMIEEAIWRDYFYARKWENTVSIVLEGDGIESRSVNLFRGRSQLSIPLSPDSEKNEPSTSPICFVWRDSEGREHESFPKLGPSGLEFESSDEDLDRFFLFPANQTIPSGESAGRLSELSRKGKMHDFINVVKSEYDWIDDLSIEVDAGAPTIYAVVRGNPEKIPLANVSGGINRMVSIMLGIASRSNSVVLVDEIENGIYFRHQQALWRGLLALSKNYNSQLFLTTHSEEWLEALVDAAENNFEDLSLWRVEYSKKGPIIHQFSGKQVLAGIKAGEVR